MPAIFEVLSVSFLVGLPIFIIAAVAQWVLQFRVFPNPGLSIAQGLSCILITFVSAYLLSMLIWLFWPLHTGLILYNDRISIPAVIAEIIALPFWMKRYGYFKRQYWFGGVDKNY